MASRESKPATAYCWKMRQEAQRFIGLLEAWTASGDEDTRAELEAMPEDEE